MSDAVTPDQFAAAEGVADWRVGASEVQAYFTTRSFMSGVRFIAEIARLAEEANHHPDIDLRYTHLVVRLSSHDIGGLSRRDIALAREISRAARQVGAVPDPSKLDA